MRSVWRRLVRTLAVMVLPAPLWIAGCGFGGVGTSTPPAPGTQFSANVPPLPTEDLIFPCNYDLLIANPSQPVQGAWVLFERADSLSLWEEPAFQSEAARLRLALVYAHQCSAATYADLQSDGQKGPARALLTGLQQLGVKSGHPELARANLAFFGFSAAGVLALTTAETMPERVLTVVTYAAGSAPLELRELTPSTALEQVPVMLLANADDTSAGTTGSQRYFAKGREMGAPWTFAVRPNVGHCCSSLATSVLVAWMDKSVPLRMATTGTLVAVDGKSGLRGTFLCTPDGVDDRSGLPDCTMTTVAVESAAFAAAVGGSPDAWLPDASFGQSWVDWISPSKTVLPNP